jgi:hypothetical protein
MTDIFAFWGQIDKSDRIHPADRPISERLRSSHGLNLKCLPSNISGPLRTAAVVLLYLSPGFSPHDLTEAETEAGREYYVKKRSGYAELPDVEHANEDATRWRRSRLAFLGAWGIVRDKVAIINIGAYHSKDFKDHHLLAALPSSRIMLDWAQTTL